MDQGSASLNQSTVWSSIIANSTVQWTRRASCVSIFWKECPFHNSVCKRILHPPYSMSGRVFCSKTPRSLSIALHDPRPESAMTATGRPNKIRPNPKARKGVIARFMETIARLKKTTPTRLKYSASMFITVAKRARRTVGLRVGPRAASRTLASRPGAPCSRRAIIRRVGMVIIFLHRLGNVIANCADDVGLSFA